MSVSDNLGDMLSRLMNATLRRKEEVVVPYTKLGKAVAEVLAGEKFLGTVLEKEESGRKVMVLGLSYGGDRPAIAGVKRISKPGVRIYLEADKIPQVLGGRGVVVLSTSGGVMSGKEARKKHLGGEVLCKVW